ncbi:biopolymer transporter ExbD [Leisingera sp.]|uniref:ExbD/TolR family protein n=1 Tax=Leisingera sp. TaxID=1879318 RepID=UPI002B276033|nr:biopolymer transporter ExbD [Leisingera sp.]
MEFTQTTKPRRRPSLTPMIDVVFLLLIIFLMTSHLALPEPFEVSPPEARLETETEAEDVLYIDAAGLMHFDGAEGEAAVARLAAAGTAAAVVQLRADARLEAALLTRILRQLAASGFNRAELAVRPK